MEGGYFKLLPYPLFLELITIGKLKDEDLIIFTSCSRFIRDKCNKDVDVGSKIISQYLFYILIEKLGIDPDNPKWKAKEYRRLYNGLIRNSQFKNLKIKSMMYREIPKTIFELLYYTQMDSPYPGMILSFLEQRDPEGFVIDFEPNNPWSKEYPHQQEDADRISHISAQYYDDFLDKESSARGYRTGDYRDDRLREALKKIFQDKVYDLPNKLKDFVVGGFDRNIDLGWFKEKISNLKLDLEYADEENLSQPEKQKLTAKIEKLKIIRRNLVLSGFPELSKMEVNYIIDLHKRFMNGEISGATPFKLKALV